MTEPSKPEKRFYEVQLGHGFHYYRACEMDAAYAELEEKLKIAVEALGFYANENNYDGMGCITDGGYTPDGQNEYWPDLGSRAKEALAPFKEVEK